jgi:two-component system, NtrC family, response regulator HydG
MTTRKDDFADVETVLAPKLSSPKSAEASFALTVVAGPDQGLTFDVARGAPSRVLAGTSPSCPLRLSDRMISRRHAAFELAGARLRVTDLGSTNGTFINDVYAVDAYVSGGELVRLGETTLRVDLVAGVEPVQLPRATRFGRLVGASAEMRRLYPLCERIAASSVPVIVEGETGTGKEVLAESLHEVGPRADKPFVVFDCTAVPPNLVESALFGHERGSFTGATESRRGVFEEANGGTLLLDELGDLELSLQAKLLRALERSEVQRVGSNRWARVDVRVLAATRRDLDREILAGRFRDDLFFRLAVARIELPPLRRRTGDVTVLAHHFWKHLAGRSVPFPAGFAQRLEDYSWPGNVRELYNAVARRVALGELAPIETARPVQEAPAPAPGYPGSAAPPPGKAAGVGTIPPPPLPSEVGAPAGARDEDDLIASVLALDLPLTRARQRVVEEFERRYVERVLAQHGGNVRNAAAASGIARRYFQLLRARRGP